MRKRWIGSLALVITACTASSAEDGQDALALTEAPVTYVTARSKCSERVVAACPADHVVVGGGIAFPDRQGFPESGKCAPAVTQQPIASELFVHAIASYPLTGAEGNGWACRVDAREVDCYAVCARSASTGIASVVRAEAHKPGHPNFGNSGAPSFVDVTCPAGTKVIGGGLKSESMWDIANKTVPRNDNGCCDLEDAEEYKVLGIFAQGNGIRCNDKSQDHWSTCYALCVSDDQLVKTSITATTLTPGTGKSACGPGQSVIGGGVSHCPTMNCSDRVDMFTARPDPATGSFLCSARALPKATQSNPSTALKLLPGCQAFCAKIEGSQN